MTKPYAGTWWLMAPSDVDPSLIALARKVVGELVDRAGASGISVLSRQVTTPDGSVVSAGLSNGLVKVTITASEAITAEPPGASDLWVPRGFVTYPAKMGAPHGYGLPIVPAPNVGTYDPSNLSPGLDTSRWTAGGPCGEVLISPDVNAAYPPPNDVPVPLLADASRGPQFAWSGDAGYDARQPDGPWSSYRLELAPLLQNVAIQPQLFEAANALRKGAGVTAATLRFRGFAHVAEMAAGIFSAAGSIAESSTTYPASFKTSADRLTKEGYTVDWQADEANSFTRTDTFGQYEFRSNSGNAIPDWQSQNGGALTSDLGPCVVADVGYRDGVSVLALSATDRWLHAGNANWQGADKDLPPISWHSFASLNLAWETYPAIYNPNAPTTAPLQPVRPFTDSHGDCWLVYPRSTTRAAALYEPALGRHIYCRGRSIALAPNGGLVWAAGIAANGNSDRLIALVHDPVDQPSDSQHQGFTRYLRVWWADIPKRSNNGLRVDPQEVICGTDANDPWGWRGGQLVDVGSMPDPSKGWKASSPESNSLKYASCWRFAPDGLRAICLRDYGTFLDYGAWSTFLNAWEAAFNPRAVELAFTLSSNAIAAGVTFHDYTDGVANAKYVVENGAVPIDQNAPQITGDLPGTHDNYDLGMYPVPAVPIAADYGADGKLVYAYNAMVTSNQVIPYDPDPSIDQSSGFVAVVQYAYVGTGDASIRYVTDLSDAVLHGARFKTPSVDGYFELAVVLDVRDAAFALKVSQPRFSVNPANAVVGVTRLDVPCATYTGALVNGVRLCAKGAIVSDDWYPCPDGALWSTNDPCYPTLADVNAPQIYLPQAVSANVQGFYAKRFGEVVYGYQNAPVPNAAPLLSAEPSGSVCGCFAKPADFDAASWLAYAQQAPRGGRVVATVPLPDNDWLIYAKVV